MLKRHSFPARTLALLMILLGIAASAAQAPAGALAATTPVSCAPDSGSGIISGTVTGTGAVPLSGVQVLAYAPDGDRGGYATSDASGNYQITGLIAGSYVLEFQPTGSGGYAPEWYNNKPTALTATPVNVSDGGTTSGINAQMDLGGHISGQVTGEGGGPINGAQVIVYDSSGQYAAQAYTDASGNYTVLAGLPTGSYRLEFKAYGYLSDYYNHKPTLEEATPVAVTAPTTVAGVNETLARGATITGKVTDSGGAPLVNMAVSAAGDNGSGYGYTDASGNYTIVGLGSGSYTLNAAPVFDDNLIGTTKTVTVTAPSTLANVNFTMLPGGTLTGKVTDTGGNPLKDITIFIGNEDNSYQNYVYTNASGEYTATALPTGDYRIFFRPSAYIPETYNNHPEYYQGDLIHVTAPNTVTGIDAVLERGSSIKGTVTDAATGLPVKDIFVEVLDANGGRAETATTQADGTYQTETTLPSGSYKVRFNADERFASCGYVTAYYNNKLTEEGANLVTVSAPNTVDHIDAALQRGSIVFGKVTDAATGAPVTQGSIIIYDSSGENVMFGRLGFLGGYRTETGLPSGTYRVKFTDYDGGYIDEFYNDKTSLAAANPVTITAPNDATGINFVVAKGGLISGHVTAIDTGAPFTNGYVVAYDNDGNEVGSTYIQSDGSYTVQDGLATGNYRVAVVPLGGGGFGLASMARSQGLNAPSAVGQSQSLASMARSRELIAPAAVSQSRGYITTFYQGTSAPGAATVVPVSAPSTTSGIDIAVLHGTLLPITLR